MLFDATGYEGLSGTVDARHESDDEVALEKVPLVTLSGEMLEYFQNEMLSKLRLLEDKLVEVKRSYHDHTAPNLSNTAAEIEKLEKEIYYMKHEVTPHLFPADRQLHQK
jgi:SMC interacting uncharacterized protein involved in chromosome segregation